MSPIPWIGYLVRLAALTAALLIGSDGAELQIAGGSTFDAATFGTLTAWSPSAFAETSETDVDRERPVGSAQVGPQTFQGGSLSGLFNRGGLLGGFAAGFLGCGLFGVLFGRGLLGDLGGAPSYVGLFVQVALLAMLCGLIWTRWHGGDASDLPMLSPRQLADPYLRSRNDLRVGFDLPVDDAHTAETEKKLSALRAPEVTEASGKRD